VFTFKKKGRKSHTGGAQASENTKPGSKANATVFVTVCWAYFLSFCLQTEENNKMGKGDFGKKWASTLLEMP
jgi:hypothetical protein